MKSIINLRKLIKPTVIIGCLLLLPWDVYLFGQTRITNKLSTDISTNEIFPHVISAGTGGGRLTDNFIAPCINVKDANGNNIANHGFSVFSYRDEVVRLQYNNSTFFTPLGLTSTLTVQGNATFNNSVTFNKSINITTPTNSTGYLHFKNPSRNLELRFGHDDRGHAEIWHVKGQNIYFGTSDRERFRIDGNGNSHFLGDVFFNANATALHNIATPKITMTGNTNNFVIQQNNQGMVSMVNSANNYMSLGTNNRSDDIVISPAGRIGSNINNPLAKLHIVSGEIGNVPIAIFEHWTPSMGNNSHGISLYSEPSGVSISPMTSNENLYFGKDKDFGSVIFRNSVYLGDGEPTETMKSTYQLAVKGRIRAWEIDLDARNW
ncbi:MAG: hypothetical protein MI922_26040, partial [Bacteroidales bacterium]|nr:hypothetical protein [Bacteroidales bacterium]